MIKGQTFEQDEAGDIISNSSDVPLTKVPRVSMENWLEDGRDVSLIALAWCQRSGVVCFPLHDCAQTVIKDEFLSRLLFFYRVSERERLSVIDDRSH
jgi:hypothetical protein